MNSSKPDSENPNLAELSNILLSSKPSPVQRARWQTNNNSGLSDQDCKNIVQITTNQTAHVEIRGRIVRDECENESDSKDSQNGDNGYEGDDDGCADGLSEDESLSATPKIEQLIDFGDATPGTGGRDGIEDEDSGVLSREELKSRIEENRLIDVSKDSHKLTESRMSEVNSFCGNAVSNFRQKFENSSEPQTNISRDVPLAARTLSPIKIANPNSGPLNEKGFSRVAASHFEINAAIDESSGGADQEQNDPLETTPNPDKHFEVEVNITKECETSETASISENSSDSATDTENTYQDFEEDSTTAEIRAQSNAVQPPDFGKPDARDSEAPAHGFSSWISKLAETELIEHPNEDLYEDEMNKSQDYGTSNSPHARSDLTKTPVQIEDITDLNANSDPSNEDTKEKNKVDSNSGGIEANSGPVDGQESSVPGDKEGSISSDSAVAIERLVQTRRSFRKRDLGISKAYKNIFEIDRPQRLMKEQNSTKLLLFDQIPTSTSTDIEKKYKKQLKEASDVKTENKQQPENRAEKLIMESIFQNIDPSGIIGGDQYFSQYKADKQNCDGPLKTLKPTEYPSILTYTEAQMDDMTGMNISLNDSKRQEYFDTKLEQQQEALAEKVTNKILKDVAHAPNSSRYDSLQNKQQRDGKLLQHSSMPILSDNSETSSNRSRYSTESETTSSKTRIIRPVPILVKAHSKEVVEEALEGTDYMGAPYSPSKRVRRVSFPVGTHLETLIDPDPNEPAQFLPHQIPATPMKARKTSSPPLFPLKPTTKTLFPEHRGMNGDDLSSDSEGSTTSSTTPSTSSSQNSLQKCDDLNIIVINEYKNIAQSNPSTKHCLDDEQNIDVNIVDIDDNDEQLSDSRGILKDDDFDSQMISESETETTDNTLKMRNDPYDIDFSYGSPNPNRSANQYSSAHRTGLDISEPESKPLTSDMLSTKIDQQIIAETTIHNDPTSRFPPLEREKEVNSADNLNYDEYLSYKTSLPAKTSRFEKYISMKKKESAPSTNTDNLNQFSGSGSKSDKHAPLVPPNMPALPISELQKISTRSRPTFSTDSLERPNSAKPETKDKYWQDVEHGSAVPDLIKSFNNGTNVERKQSSDDNHLHSDDSSEQGIYNVQDNEATCGLYPQNIKTKFKEVIALENDRSADVDDQRFTGEPISGYVETATLKESRYPIQLKSQQIVQHGAKHGNERNAANEKPRIIATASSLLPHREPLLLNQHNLQYKSNATSNQAVPQHWEDTSRHIMKYAEGDQASPIPPVIIGGSKSAFVSMSESHRTTTLSSNSITKQRNSQSATDVADVSDHVQRNRSLPIKLRSRSADKEHKPAWAKDEWKDRSNSSDRQVSPIQSPPGNVGYLVNIWENRVGGGVIRPLPPEITSPCSLSSGGHGSYRSHDFLRGSMPNVPDFMMSPTSKSTSSSMVSPNLEDQQPPDGTVSSMVDLYCTSPPLKEFVKKQFTPRDMFPDHPQVTMSVPNVSGEEDRSNQQNQHDQVVKEMKQVTTGLPHLRKHSEKSSTQSQSCISEKTHSTNKQNVRPTIPGAKAKTLPNKVDEIVKYMEMTVSVPDLQTSTEKFQRDGFRSPPNLLEQNSYQDVVQSLENLSNMFDLYNSTKLGDRSQGRNRLSDLMADLEHDAELQEAFKNRYKSNSDLEDSVKSPVSVTSPNSTITGDNVKSPDQDYMTSPPPYEHFRNLNQDFGKQNVYHEVVHLLDQVSSSIDNLNRLPSVPDGDMNIGANADPKRDDIIVGSLPSARWFEREFDKKIKEQENRDSVIDLGPPKPPAPEASKISAISKSLDALGAYKEKLSAFVVPSFSGEMSLNQSGPSEIFRPINHTVALKNGNFASWQYNYNDQHTNHAGQDISTKNSQGNISSRIIAPIRPAPSIPPTVDGKYSDVDAGSASTRWLSDNYSTVIKRSTNPQLGNNVTKESDQKSNKISNDKFDMEADIADAQKWLDRASKTIEGISFDMNSENPMRNQEVPRRSIRMDSGKMSFLPFNTRNSDTYMDYSSINGGFGRADGYRYPGGVINGGSKHSHPHNGIHDLQNGRNLQLTNSNHDIPSFYSSRWVAPSEAVSLSRRYSSRPAPERLSRSSSQLGMLDQELEEREREMIKRNYQYRNQEVKARSSSASRWADRPRFAEESAEKYLNYKSDFERGSSGLSVLSIPESRLRVIELLNKIR